MSLLLDLDEHASDGYNEYPDKISSSIDNQEHSCLSRLQDSKTWMIGGVLMMFLMLDLGDTFCKASLEYFEHPGSICS